MPVDLDGRESAELPLQVALWDAINEVVAASGGSTSCTSVARQQAVVKVHAVLEPLAVELQALRARVAEMEKNATRFVLKERDQLRCRAEAAEARIAEMERALDMCRVDLGEAQHAVGEAWFAGGATLTEAITRKCRMLEDDAEHWRKAAEARSLRAEYGDHVLHRFAAIAAAKNEGRSAITLTVWSDGTIEAEQYATLDGEIDEWGTLYQDRRASWGSRPIGELDVLASDLESDDWYTVEHRAPQDFWRELQSLRDEVERLRRDNEMACENTPWPGCECPGCETARARAVEDSDG